MVIGRRIGIIAAGEQWPDGSLRPALEDQFGEGAVIANLSGSLSPESQAALHLCDNSQAQPSDIIINCVSGRELTERGFTADI